MSDKRGTNSLVTQRHDRVWCISGDAEKHGHRNPNLKINENKAIATACARMSTLTQKLKRPDLVYESISPETGKIKW
jgi:hypothetical protein